MIRLAAVGDLHAGTDSRGALAAAFSHVAAEADVLLLAGDLTRVGTPAEAAVLGDELRSVPIPKLAVLGNHDHHGDEVAAVVATLAAGGITVLEGTGVRLEIGGLTLGVAGAKGFGGGFAPSAVSAFGERELKRFVEHTCTTAARLRNALGELTGCDRRVALLHYAPVRDTVQGEPPEIHAFLGSQLLAEAVDAAGADLVLHGHAHHGAERGSTPGGIPVRNVAMPLIGCAYRVFALGAAVPAGAPGARA
ncbi:MAG: metallophosphoesterase [Acidimicrobiales bacterium]|nr:metallophosphoesterase [Acidimicrobiales bacterium]